MLTILQYVLDGYFESHDPNKPTCKEPTRGITLNILDCGPSSREQSPTSSTSSRSSHSSRFASPTSSAGTSPSSTHSSRSFRRRTPSPPPHRPASHIIQPIPRNPLARHGLTLDTNCRPVSMMTDATRGSPTSASSSRSNSSIGSACSSCSSGSTVFSEDSPTTPICDCRFTSEHRRGACEGSWDSEGSCSGDSCSEDEDEYQAQKIRVSRRASYHPSKAGHGGQLAYEFERKLRM